jgi:hypothetical protein
MITHAPQSLSDRELLDATARVAALARATTVDLITLLAEVDARRLYLGEGCASLFTYCTEVLRLSEHAAYHRIEAARAARAFPVVLELLREGALTLTTVGKLRRHLTPANHAQVLEKARFKSTREVEHQVACLAPQPDARTVVRKLPTPGRAPDPTLPSTLSREPTVIPSSDRVPDLESPTDGTGPAAATAPVVAPPLRPRLIPIADDRYMIKVTISAETHAKLAQAQDLLRHAIPNGDPAAILDRALTLLVEQLERAKVGKAARPRAASVRSSGRHVPAAVRREVWARDQGRCAFEGPHGRCHETGRLEFHHVEPFARGGPTDASNLSLRCRAHNQYEGEKIFGRLNGAGGFGRGRGGTRCGPS